ncbi:MAG: alpha/beta hydrolase [Rhizobiaceae bacterium]
MDAIRPGVPGKGANRLHYAETGAVDAPLIICLHGFPEYWAAWREVMLALAPGFRVAAPDQRGYNLSPKPQDIEAYRVRRLVADIAALADELSPLKPFVLAGHDWGAAVAYAYAFAYPDRLTHLVIANGAHPACFQRAIFEDEGQRAASQYINTLRRPGTAARMAENGFARTLNMIEGFSKSGWMNDALRAGYLEAWAQPGAMVAMLNWYRASPIIVPKPGEPAPVSKLLQMPADRLAVRVPHLVLWGEDDEALRPACLDGLDTYAADLTVERVAGAGHWILHEKPAEVADAIRRFVG